MPPTPTGPDERLAPRAGFALAPGIERADGIVRLRDAAAARDVLRARGATRQAGFTAERIPERLFRRRPILIGEGPEHDAQRAELGRFFAPAVVARRHASAIEAASARWLGRARRIARERGHVLVEDLALHFSVDVAAGIVGLTAAPVPRLARRLERFFRQPPLDMSRPDLGRRRRDWALAAWRALAPLAAFHLLDVRPAIRERRASPRDDVISALLAAGRTEGEILAECLTYGTAGMVTTREFIALAAWRLLEDAGLRARFQSGDGAERTAILAELIRLDPIVGRLYRRVTAPVRAGGSAPDAGACPTRGGETAGGEAAGGEAASGEAASGEAAIELEPGELVEIRVDEANARAAEACPLAVRPGRPMPRPGAVGLSFGDGAHRCPGEHLALREATSLLAGLLALDPELVGTPRIEWDDLVAGPRVRGLAVRFRE